MFILNYCKNETHVSLYFFDTYRRLTNISYVSVDGNRSFTVIYRMFLRLHLIGFWFELDSDECDDSKNSGDEYEHECIESDICAIDVI